MSPDPASTPRAGAHAVAQESPCPRWLVGGLGLVLVVAVYISGSPGLDAPWIQGDEFIFVARNADVNPDAAPPGADTALGPRCLRIFTKVHDDLYQPIPILSYALEWVLTGGETLGFRRTDLLLHALNALLVWWVLAAALARVNTTRSALVPVLAWALALLWALHPMLVSAYASDMGRTHLLSATFSLVALGLYLGALQSAGWVGFAGAIGALLLAMLCKPVPGWLLVALVLDAAHLGWRPALRTPRLYVIAAICVVFAVLTVRTSGEAGLLEDASKGLFGDPVARSALAVWIYVRNLVAPFWLAFWYLPDPTTGWANPRVWAGLAVAIAATVGAVWAWRRPPTRMITFGCVWCAALLLPVIGLVGAREVAAVDRYFYQPLVGVLLIVGVVLVRGLAKMKPAAAIRLVMPVAAILALAMLLWDLPQCQVARSAIRRATRLVELNPGDPRALEALSAAYDFARNHPLPPDESAQLAADVDPFVHFGALLRETLARAAAVPDLAHYFPGPEDRGPFHRRLSYRFLTAGSPEESLAQAEQALALLPDEFVTWKRLAHAYQALGRQDDAVRAYERCEQLLPDSPQTRAVHFTDFGNLLLFDLERDADACPKFAAAFETGAAPPQAKAGLALCHIRYGRGDEGFRLICEVLESDPGDVRAGLILAEYHLRSHHWKEAGLLYDAIIRDQPINYAALRGFHEVCIQVGEPAEAALAWQDALAHLPEQREFRSFHVWASALADEPSARALAEELLQDDPENPLACLALMLDALRGDDPDAAVAWVRRAVAGQPIPKARSFERAVASLQLMVARGDLPRTAELAQAAIYLAGDFPPAARTQAATLIDGFLAETTEPRHKVLAERLLRELSDVKSAP